MSERVLYLFSVVAVGWLVTFGLRALPFLIFAGRDRELPRWVERLGVIISPIIIGGLIVYSYTGLEWRTAWPYLAGLLTIGLQLWRRNPLLSIIAGTALYMLLLGTCGCATTTVEPELKLDAEHPVASVTSKGIFIGERSVSPMEVVEYLEDHDVSKSRTIYILFAPDVTNMQVSSVLMATLAKAGYKRPLLVTKRHGESYTTGKKPKATASDSRKSKPAKRKMRYKKANE